ncbi:MAG: hypothetical protein ABI238_03665 [Terrimesophilobacter sp.]
MVDVLVDPREQIAFVRDCWSPAERAALVRRHREGEIVRVARGAYVDATLWESLDRAAQYRLRLHAVAERLSPNTIFSHESAAVLWRLPWIGSWPNRVHTAGMEASGGRSGVAVFQHTTGLSDHPDLIEGRLVTPLARTVVDIARTTSFATAVTVADAALRRSFHPVDSIPASALTREELQGELALVPLRHGSAKARAVIEFADGRADRPGESMSRVNIRIAGLPAPQLQVRMRGRSGRLWIVDFWWPESNLIGEFDGKWKYSEPEFLRGRTPHQVLLDEKFREDDLRAAAHNFTRWDWALALSPPRLRAHLLAAGLR